MAPPSLRRRGPRRADYRKADSAYESAKELFDAAAKRRRALARQLSAAWSVVQNWLANLGSPKAQPYTRHNQSGALLMGYHTATSILKLVMLWRQLGDARIAEQAAQRALNAAQKRLNQAIERLHSADVRLQQFNGSGVQNGKSVWGDDPIPGYQGGAKGALGDSANWDIELLIQIMELLLKSDTHICRNVKNMARLILANLRMCEEMADSPWRQRLFDETIGRYLILMKALASADPNSTWGWVWKRIGSITPPVSRRSEGD